MAYSYALIHRTATSELYEVTETLDADTGGNLLHTLGRIPDKVTLTPIGITARLSDYVATAITAALVTLSSTAAVGSGAALPQLRVLLEVAPDQIR